MMMSFDNLMAAFGPITIVFVVALVLIWAILLFLLPFFVYGAWQRAKECSLKLDQLVQLARAQAAIDAADIPDLDEDY